MLKKRQISRGVGRINERFGIMDLNLGQANSNLIECTRQPGRLKISPRACGLRYLLAQENPSRSLYYDDFSFAFRRGLDVCKSCPEGGQNAKTCKRMIPVSLENESPSVHRKGNGRLYPRSSLTRSERG